MSGRGKKDEKKMLCTRRDGGEESQPIPVLSTLSLNESNYLINDSSCRIICMNCLLWSSTRSSRQDARGRRGNGGRRVSLETNSPPTPSGPSCPHYLCQ